MDPTPSSNDWSIVQWAIDLGLAVLAFIGIRQVDRIDKLEDSCMSREEFECRLLEINAARTELKTELRGDIKDLRDENRSQFRHLEAKLDAHYDKQVVER